MTLLDELKPMRSRHDERRRVPLLRVALGLGVGVAMFAAAGIPIYADHYQPIGYGYSYGPGTLQVLTDGGQETGVRITAATSPGAYHMSPYNNGPFDVRVTRIGYVPSEPPLLGVTASELVLNAVAADGSGYNKTVPFHPFTLHSHEYVGVNLAVTARPCGDSRSLITMRSVSVAFRFLGQSAETDVPLNSPIKRVCPDSPFPTKLNFGASSP